MIKSFPKIGQIIYWTPLGSQRPVQLKITEVTIAEDKYSYKATAKQLEEAKNDKHGYSFGEIKISSRVGGLFNNWVGTEDFFNTESEALENIKIMKRADELYFSMDLSSTKNKSLETTGYRKQWVKK